MAVLGSHTQMRSSFAEYAFVPNDATVTSFNFIAGSPARISRTIGSYLDPFNLFKPGHTIQFSGTASNDGRYTIDSVNPSIITLVPSDSVVNEGPVSAEVRSCYIDYDGFDRWPLGLLRSHGFDGGFLGIPIPYNGSPFLVTCNLYAPDAVKNVDDYDWYLSQRTDDASQQYLKIVQLPDTFTASLSGTVAISQTPLADDVFGTSIEPTDVVEIFKNCHLYVQRRPKVPLIDKSIQWIDLLKAMVADVY